MAEHRPVRPEIADRSPEERLADHAAIDRLADDLLPALVAKLGASALGEIEVREGAWRVRVRRPATAADASRERRTSDRPSRAQPGHAGHGHAFIPCCQRDVALLSARIEAGCLQTNDARVIERPALPDLRLTLVVDQLDGESARDEGAEGAAGLDLGELAVIADQHELPVGSFHVLEQL